MKPCLEVEIPASLGDDWRAAILVELDAAEYELPRLSPAAVELAALVVSGEYNAVAVGEILEGDAGLKRQVLDLANSALYAGSDPVESSSSAAQRCLDMHHCHRCGGVFCGGGAIPRGNASGGSAPAGHVRQPRSAPPAHCNARGVQRPAACTGAA